MFKIPTVKPKVAFSFLYGFFVLVFFLFLFFMFKKDEFEDNQHSLYVEKADITFEFLDSQYSIADKLANDAARKIEDNLLITFKYEPEELVRQLNDLKYGVVKENLVTYIIIKTIKDNTFRNVGRFIANSSDRNDMLVFLANVIIVDLSNDCAPKFGIRNINSEYKKQFNFALARDAMERLVASKSTRAFWHYTPLYQNTDKYYSDVLSIQRSNLYELKQKFLENNCDFVFLEHFEFLSVSHIKDKDYDILGNSVKYPNGNIIPSSLQLHIVQGFNLYDVMSIDSSFKSKVSEIDSRIEKNIYEFNIFQAFCVIFCFILFVVFVFLLVIIDLSEHKYRLEHPECTHCASDSVD